MDYEKEEEHLQHANEAEGVEQIKHDLESHFESGGVQTLGDLDVTKHSTAPEAAFRDFEAPITELAQELEGMAQRHAGSPEGDFVRGVAGLEFAYAEEDADAE